MRVAISSSFVPRGAMIKGPPGVLESFLYGGSVPVGDLEASRDFHRLRPHGLPQGKGRHRSRIRDVFSEDEDGVRLCHLAKGGSASGAVFQDPDDFPDEPVVAPGHTGIKMVGPDQGAKCKIGLQGRARGADPDQRGICGKPGFQFLQDRRNVYHVLVGESLDQGFPDPRRAVDELVAVPAPVAEEVAVHLAVVAVPYAPEHPVALARDRVAAQAAMDADGWRGLQVPVARVVAL